MSRVASALDHSRSTFNSDAGVILPSKGDL
jgi:hypothetical protein